MNPPKIAAGLWVRLAKCYGLVLREVQRDDGRRRLTLPQFDALAQLLRHPDGMTAGELSRALLVTAGNVTGIVARLEARGLLERVAHPTDGRAVILRLTPTGRAQARSGVALHERKLSRIFRGVPSTQQIALQHSLERLRAALERRARSPARRNAG